MRQRFSSVNDLGDKAFVEAIEVRISSARTAYIAMPRDLVGPTALSEGLLASPARGEGPAPDQIADLHNARNSSCRLSAWLILPP